MKKVFVPTECPYWIWEMPEVVAKIPELFNELGDARITSTEPSPQNVYVEVMLKKPAKVVNWAEHVGDGLAINSYTGAIMGVIAHLPSQYVTKLPCNGDSILKLYLKLELQNFNEHAVVTIEEMENALRSMASMMTKTWYYYFN